HEADDVTVAQVHLHIRTQDPFSELGMILGGHRAEDWMWMTVLRNVAARFDVEAKATKDVVCLDPRRRWSEWRSIRQNAGLHSIAYALGAPVRALGSLFRS